MLDRIDQSFEFQSRALALRAERQKVLAGNVANADTPGYKAVDFNFADALRAATGAASGRGQPTALGQPMGRGQPPVPGQPLRTHANHLGQGGTTGAGAPEMLYRQPTQAAIDNNTVDMDLERAQFADNAIRYEATLRFITGQIRTMQQAIQTQS